MLPPERSELGSSSSVFIDEHDKLITLVLIN